MGPFITLLYTKGDGPREAKDWTQGLIVTGSVPTGAPRVKMSVHICSTVQERGCLPAQAAAEGDEDAHTAFSTTVGTDRRAAGVVHLGSSLKGHGGSVQCDINCKKQEVYILHHHHIMRKMYAYIHTIYTCIYMCIYARRKAWKQTRHTPGS